MDSRKYHISAGPLLVLSLALLMPACSTSSNVADQWAQKVEAGEYGWINFNNGETKNLDSYPQERIDYLESNLYPEYTQRCFEQLRDYSRVEIEIQFLISPQGRPQQFEIISTRARECARNIMEALSSFSFSGGVRQGKPVTAVGVYTRELSSGAGGYGN